MIQVLEFVEQQVELHAAWGCSVCGRRIWTAHAVCPVRDPKTPKCCGREMHILLCHAGPENDAPKDFQTAWGCRGCGHFRP